MGRDVAEQVLSMGREPRVACRGLERAVGQAPCLVEPAEHQTGATQRTVDPAAMGDDSARCEMLDELLALVQPAQRFIGVAELRQDPGGGGHKQRQHEDNVCRPENRDPMLDQ